MATKEAVFIESTEPTHPRIGEDVICKGYPVRFFGVYCKDDSFCAVEGLDKDGILDIWLTEMKYVTKKQ